jgi:hypothetical protein
MNCMSTVHEHGTASVPRAAGRENTVADAASVRVRRKLRRRRCAKAPKGARFDSPGRVSPGLAVSIISRQPQRGEIPFHGRCSMARGISPLWGCAHVQVAYPGLRRLSRLRPGLSNLAPFGAALSNADSDNGTRIATPAEPFQGSLTSAPSSQGSPTFVGLPWAALRNAFSVETDPGRVAAISRGLSAATPPVAMCANSFRPRRGRSRIRIANAQYRFVPRRSSEARLSHGLNTDETQMRRRRLDPCFFRVSSVARFRLIAAEGRAVSICGSFRSSVPLTADCI